MRSEKDNESDSSSSRMMWRHLEIMASGAVPYFVDLPSLPPRTLTLYPRRAIADAMALPESYRSNTAKEELMLQCASC